MARPVVLSFRGMKKSLQSVFIWTCPALSPEMQIQEVGVNPRHLPLGNLGLHQSLRTTGPDNGSMGLNLLGGGSKGKIKSSPYWKHTFLRMEADRPISTNHPRLTLTKTERGGKECF